EPTNVVSGGYSGLDVGQASLVGVQRHLGPVGELELPEDVRDVRLDRPLADLELPADLLVRPAVGDEQQYLALARREVVIALVPVPRAGALEGGAAEPPEFIEHPRGDRRIDQREAVGNGADGIRQLGRG